jgi:hypothetical protein
MWNIITLLITNLNSLVFYIVLCVLFCHNNIILFKCLLQPASQAQAYYEAIYI